MQCSMVPGLSLAKSSETRFHKPQRFVFRNGLRMEEDADKKAPKVPEADRLIGRNAFQNSEAPVLTFQAYYSDGPRFRKCRVLYYLADDEIKVYEPRQRNSGLEQGCIVGKGRFRKPGGDRYTVDDLNVGETLTLFGRDYKLTDCDAFTRTFLTEAGYRVRTPEPQPEDPLEIDREEENIPKSYRRPYTKEYKYKKFFQHHPKSLRFYGYYGNGKNLFEEKREATLYYDLADGKIKIVEERCKNKWIDGRKDTRVLLRPTLVPKVVESSLLAGELCDPTLLTHAHDVKNVLIGGRYYKIQNPTSVLVDSNPMEGRKKAVEYYTDRDLDLGVKLNIYGFEVFLHDCDDFTKNYYLSTHNRELKPVARPEVKPFHSHKLIYQHELFGEPEQTIRTNDPFIPIRYMADLSKFFQKDHYGYEVQELKFLARSISEDPVEKLRGFLVRWFLEDDTMDIRALDLDFEKTSIMEHKHLKRMKVIKPRSSVGNFERCYYKPTDLFVGTILYVRGRAYELLDADEYTYDYMERNCHIFQHANIKRIVTMLRPWAKDNCEALKTKLEGRDPHKTGTVRYDDFKSSLSELMDEDLRLKFPEHAMRTLSRAYAEDRYVGLKVEDMASMIRTELYRRKFYDLDDVRTTLEMHDDGKTGELTQKRLYFALRSTSLPINRDLLKSFVYKFPSEGGKVKYLDVLHSMDWLKNNTQYEKQDPGAVNLNWEHTEHEKNLQKIQYNVFLTDMMMQQ